MPLIKEPRPNIVWISFEDTSPFYPCYGDDTARLPNLDRLASEGCVWNRCFSTAGVCAPARCAVITGMYANAIGAHHMRTTHPVNPDRPAPYCVVPPPHVKCFTEYLRAEGYFCSNNSKTDYQFATPFTAWDECHDDAHFRNRKHPSQPFFAVFNPVVTHESGMWPEKGTVLTVDPAKVPLPPFFPDTPKVRDAMARMYSNLETADAFLGKILGELEADGLLENTVVFHWSDHGPLPRGKRWPYDSGIHVPLIVRWPAGIPANSRCDDLVSTIDLGPTVLSLAGVDIPRHLQGRAFLGPQREKPREHIFASRDRHDESYDFVRAVRDKRFKYIRNYYPQQGYLPWVPYLDRHPIMQELRRMEAWNALVPPQDILFKKRRAEELYDMLNDPWELENLIDLPEHQQRIQGLRVVLDAWMSEIQDLGIISEEEMVRRWWPDGIQPKTATPVLMVQNRTNGGLQNPIKQSGQIHLSGPSFFQLLCPTQGASIGYTFETGPKAKWELYTSPAPLPSAKGSLRVKAVRIGYQESEEVSWHFDSKDFQKF
ncbi:MAG: sulfatase [Spirochaetia bacterium]|nr:sulfatase [Spirochaetia bacterium]